MTGEKERFSRMLRAVKTVARPGDDVYPSLGPPTLYLQGMWAQKAVCRLLAVNVGSLAVIVGASLSLLAQNVGSNSPLFASPSHTVCKPLQLLGRERRSDPHALRVRQERARRPPAESTQNFTEAY